MFLHAEFTPWTYLLRPGIHLYTSLRYVNKKTKDDMFLMEFGNELLTAKLLHVHLTLPNPTCSEGVAWYLKHRQQT